MRRRRRFQELLKETADLEDIQDEAETITNQDEDDHKDLMWDLEGIDEEDDEEVKRLVQRLMRANVAARSETYGARHQARPRQSELGRHIRTAAQIVAEDEARRRAGYRRR